MTKRTMERVKGSIGFLNWSQPVNFQNNPVKKFIEIELFEWSSELTVNGQIIPTENLSVIFTLRPLRDGPLLAQQLIKGDF